VKRSTAVARKERETIALLTELSGFAEKQFFASEKLSFRIPLAE